MEIQEQLTSKEIFDLAKEIKNLTELPKQLYDFFDKNFDFKEWDWIDKDFFRQRLDAFNDIIYVEDFSKKERLIKSISWIIRILQDEQATCKNQMIAFELTYLLPNFWEISYDEGILFSDSIKKLALANLNSIRFSLGSGNESISKKEMIDNILSYLSNHQWKKIEENFSQINNIFSSVSRERTSYSFLVEHHNSEILNFIDNEKNISKLLYWLTLLPERYKQPFALKTNNYRTKFLLLLNLIHLTGDDFRKEQLELADIWESCPIEWFQAFNKYPVSYPWLQLGLGKFLTSATDEQIRIYIESLDLTTPPEDIRDCLNYFFTNSNQERIRYFCELSYEKWEQWNFNDRYSVVGSCLDIAIVEYFQKLVTDEEREKFIQDKIDQIFYLNKRWFSNIVNLNKFVYLQLSKMQPACIAGKLKQDDSSSLDELSKKIYRPAFFNEDPRWNNWLTSIITNIR